MRRQSRYETTNSSIRAHTHTPSPPLRNALSLRNLQKHAFAVQDQVGPCGNTNEVHSLVATSLNRQNQYSYHALAFLTLSAVRM